MAFRWFVFFNLSICSRLWMGTDKSLSVWGKVKRTVKDYVSVYIGGEELKSSSDHDFKTSDGWKPASALRKGMMVFSLAMQSFIPLDSIATVLEPLEVEGLMLKDVEAFGVGKFGLAIAPSNGWCVKGLDLIGHQKLNDWLTTKGLSELDAKTITKSIESQIDGKIIYAVEKSSTDRFIIQADRGAMTNKVFSVEPNLGGGYAVNKYEPTYDPLANTNIDVDISTKGYLVPDYSTKGGSYLHPENRGKTIRIEMTGNRSDDYSNALTELQSQLNDNSFLKPQDYTWHHLDDFEFDAATGKSYCTMQLVETAKHTAVGMAHSGSVAQFKKFGLIGY